MPALIVACSFVTLLVLHAGPQRAGAFSKEEQNCLSCHTLTNDEAKKVLSELIPDLKVLMVQASPMKGLWEIGFDSGGRKGIAYLDFSKKFVLAGNMLSIATKENLTQESFAKINKVDVATIPLGDALVLGDKNAKHKIIVFDDPD